jgi:hypothetical protein
MKIINLINPFYTCRNDNDQGTLRLEIIPFDTSKPSVTDPKMV